MAMDRGKMPECQHTAGRHGDGLQFTQDVVAEANPLQTLVISLARYLAYGLVVDMLGHAVVAVVNSPRGPEFL